MRRLVTMCVLIVSSLSAACSQDVRSQTDPLPTRLDSKRQGSEWAPNGSPTIVPEQEDDGAFGKSLCAAPPNIAGGAFECSNVAPVIDGQSTIEEGIYVLTDYSANACSHLERGSAEVFAENGHMYMRYLRFEDETTSSGTWELAANEDGSITRTEVCDGSGASKNGRYLESYEHLVLVFADSSETWAKQ